MRGPSLLRAALVLAVASTGLLACPDDPKPVDDTTVADTVADVADSGEADTAEDDADGVAADTADTEQGDGFVPTDPGEFVLGTADLSEEYVFKGVWAGAADQIVAVGNDGVVASRDADGRWSVLARAEGAALLNAVHGSDPEHLWAVGMNGTILPGSVTSFGESGACASNSDCEDLDPCTIDLCNAQGACVVEPSGLSGCCGTPAATFGFESGVLTPWTVPESSGTVTWQLSQRRASEGTWSLYFGDPSKEPPNYDNGSQVIATAASPAITLPTSGTATLRFDVFLDSEPDTSFDVLGVSVDTGTSRVLVWDKSQLVGVPTGGFVQAEADLTPWRGKTITLRFRFDSVDGSLNTYEGAYIDHIVVDTTCQAPGEANSQTGPTLWGVYAVAEDVAYAVGRAGAILQWDGERWEPAQGNDLSTVWNGVAGAEGGHIALVGNSGKVAVATGGGLADVDVQTSWNIHAVATADGQRYFAVGDQGTILTGAGGDWSVMQSPTTVSLRDVFAVANDDVWAVGFVGTVLHYDGAGWDVVPLSATADLQAVWVSEAGLVTVAGADGELYQAAQGGIDDFVHVGAFNPGGDLVAAWGSADALFLVGSGGRVVASLDGAWNVQASGTSQALQSVFGFAADDVWAVGRAGTILHWDGTAWTRVESPTSAALNAIWGPSAGEVYAAGSGGALIAWNGVAWSNLVGSTDANLRAAFGLAANDVWAVGAGGVIMHFGGLGWAKSPVEKIPTEDGEEEIVDELHAVWAAAHDDAWAVGADGRILHWDGQLWTRVETELGITLRGIYGLAANDIWAVGNAGHIIHYDGAAWTPMETGSIATLHAIHGDGAGHVVVVGSLGTVMTLERD
ncbi:MAG: hypothetical protein EP329_12005 [Deltaproteobacteria bacterium]|nr:MAG: hypothetical protein EP329_12005 [Deltaproteobacteria bacterium]